MVSLNSPRNADLQPFIINSTIMIKHKKNIKDIKTMYEHKETIGDYPVNAKPDIRLFDNFDWAALGIAACGIVLFIHLILGGY